MILYIYLQVKPIQEVSFGSPLTSCLKAVKEELVFVELDNHSESFLVTQCLPLIPKADQVILHSEVQEGEAVGALKSIFEKLRKFDKPVLNVRQGGHKGIASMLKLMKVESKSVSDSSEAKSLISDFLNSSIGD